ncbi:MAG: hypothetical protein D6702_04675 [Planctomycetota bacterium]|nr:MAG: hypothetical protein D6702_04675 [Planctomycetota bacterium]
MDLASGWFGGRPALASAQLRQARDQGWSGVSLLPEDPSLELEGIEEARRDLGRGFSAAAWDALQAPAHRTAADGHSSAVSTTQEAALARIGETLRRLERLDAPLLVVASGLDDDPRRREEGEALLGRLSCGERIEPEEGPELHDRLPRQDRERQLEAFARFLFELIHRAGGRRVAIAAAPSPAAVLDPEGLALLFGEPSLRGLGYWHRTGAVQARAALGLEEPGAWLEAGAAAAVGATLEDWGEGRGRLFPGEGEVDLRLLAEYLPRRAVRVLSLAPGYPGAALQEAREALESLGLG